MVGRASRPRIKNFRGETPGETAGTAAPLAGAAHPAKVLGRAGNAPAELGIIGLCFGIERALDVVRSHRERPAKEIL